LIRVAAKASSKGARLVVSMIPARSSSERSEVGRTREASTSAGDLISVGSTLERLDGIAVVSSGRPLLRFIETRFAAAKVAFAALSVAEAALRISKSVLARSSMLLKRQD
jgi:hypothetical protein